MFELKLEVKWELGSMRGEMAEVREQSPSANCRELSVKPRRTGLGWEEGRKAGRQPGGRTGNGGPGAQRGRGFL